LIEVILLAILNRIDANRQCGTVKIMYKVAVSEMYLVQVSGLWGHMGIIKHTQLLQLQRCSQLESLLQN
jgi:hypothetical protein